MTRIAAQFSAADRQRQATHQTVMETAQSIQVEAADHAATIEILFAAVVDRLSSVERRFEALATIQSTTAELVQQVTATPKDGTERNIGLHRIHMEEDAGKSIHLAGETDTRIDFNRAGVPLIEIVTNPDVRNSDEAYALLTEIRQLVRYLDICDGNMEEGSLRCDANISMMLKGATEFGKKVEVKNMNSIRNVQRAIDYEIERQIMQLEKDESIVSETRTFNAADGKTYSMRVKEELNDYRYFPDPDLSPLEVSVKWLNEIKSSMPLLPRELHHKFVTTYHLSEYDAQVLTDSKETAQYFEEVCRHSTNFKAASNWIDRKSVV